jgi:uncharacterized protein (DUF885 family)
MKNILVLLLLLASMCSQAQGYNADKEFNDLKVRFLDAYWKQYPADAISVGYGKYYERLAIPDNAYFASSVSFSKQWLDSLHAVRIKELSENNQISYNIIENRLKQIIWEIDTLKIYQWSPAKYNIGMQCHTIITEPFAPLDERLGILSKHLQHTGEYYKAAFNALIQPTKEHTLLAITQNEGALSVFGSALTDSINTSHLSTAEKDTLQQRIQSTTTAIRDYVAALKNLLADTNYSFRNFRIGENLFNQKFQYEIVTDYQAKEIFNKAVAAKVTYHKEMYRIANQLWTKYCSHITKPADSLLLIKTVIDKISLNHVAADKVFDTLNKQVHELKRFVVQKKLFDFDTTAPIVVRKMPAFASGSSIAAAKLPAPYQKISAANYFIADFSTMPPDKAESQLREYNNYTLQLLTIHESVPGHCMQGTYISQNSPDIVKSVLNNSAMIEGWAVYSERMMLENGWGNNEPEMWLMFYKNSLRASCNVIVDYGIHCLNYTKEDVVKLLRDEAFQEEAQIEQKYNRATRSQVQLSTYFTGATEILALREAYKKKMGSTYNLKDFHEQFLSYGSAPVKFIREAMLNK